MVSSPGWGAAKMVSPWGQVLPWGLLASGGAGVADLGPLAYPAGRETGHEGGARLGGQKLPEGAPALTFGADS